MAVGEKIKLVRQQKKISQQKLGDMLGVSQAMIAQYENGKRNPKLETIRKIAGALEVPFDEIVPFDDGLKLWLNEKKEEKSKELPEHHMSKLANVDAPSNPPCITSPANGEYAIYIDIDRDNPLNIALKKVDDGVPLTPEESQIIKEYINSDIFQEKLTQLPARFKKLADSIKRNYELLNTEGQKEADRQVELANRQIELLTKIPEYRKKPDDTE